MFVMFVTFIKYVNKCFRLGLLFSFFVTTTACTLGNTINNTPNEYTNTDEKDGSYYLNQAKKAIARDDGINAVKNLEKAGALGKGNAYHKLGFLYHQGTIIGRDIDQSIYWFEKASQHNIKDSMYNLGLIYINTANKEYSPEKSAHWLGKAASMGHLDAQYNLGVIYSQGAKGIPRDYELAYKWWERASNANHADSMNNIAGLYYQGNGVTMDFGKSNYWYKRSCKAGYAPACENLRELFDLSKVSIVNERRLIKWAVNGLSENHPFALLYDQINRSSRDSVKDHCEVLFSLSYDYKCSMGSGATSGTIKVDFDSQVPKKALVQINYKNMEKYLTNLPANDNIKGLRSPRYIKMFLEEWFLKINRKEAKVTYTLDDEKVLIKFVF